MAKLDDISPPVFISYARSDLARVHWIEENLTAQGVHFFIDRQMATAQRWQEELQTQIARCACVLVIWTNSSVHSDWVPAELEWAERHSKPIVPVRLDVVEPPAPWGEFNVADLSNWRGNSGHPEWRKVMSSIESTSPARRKLPSVGAMFRTRLNNQLQRPLDFEGIEDVNEFSEDSEVTIRARSETEFDHHVKDLIRAKFLPVTVQDQFATFRKTRRFNRPLAAALFIGGVVPGLVYVAVMKALPKSEIVHVTLIQQESSPRAEEQV